MKSRKRFLTGIILIMILMINSTSISVAMTKTNTEDQTTNILEDLKHITSNDIKNVLSKFPDMGNHWSRDTVGKLSKLGIIHGYLDGSFRPNHNIQIDEFIKLIVTAMGYTPEAGKGYWAEPYIQIAKEQKLIGNNEFANYKKLITRQEMSKIIVNATLSKEDAPDDKFISFLKTKIKDYTNIDDSHKESVLAAYGMGLISGYPDGTFKGSNNSTRAEASLVIMRFIDPTVRNKNIVDEKDIIVLRNIGKGKDETIYPPSSEAEMIRITHALIEAAETKSKGYANTVYDGDSKEITINLYEKEEDKELVDPKLSHASIIIRIEDVIEYQIIIRNIEETIKLHDQVLKDALEILFESDANKAITHYEKSLKYSSAYNTYIGKGIVLNDRNLDLYMDGGPLGISISIKGYRFVLP